MRLPRRHLSLAGSRGDPHTDDAPSPETSDVGARSTLEAPRPGRLVELRRRLAGSGLGARLARGASGAFAVRIAAAAVGFGLQVLLARLLGAEQYGTFTYAFSWMMVLVVFARLGLGNAVIRYVATYESTESWSRLRGLLRRTDQWVLAAGVAVAALGAVAVWALRARLDPELEKALYLGLAALPLFALLGVKEAVVRGFRRPALGQLPDAIVRPACTGILVLIVFAGAAAPLSASDAMLAANVGIGVALLFAMGLLHRTTPAVVRGSQPDVTASAEWRGLGLSLLLIGGMNILRSRTDVLMIGAFLGATDVAFYAAAARYAELMLFGLQSVNVFAGPVIAGLFSQGRHDEIQRMVGLAALAIAGVTVPLGIALLVLGRPLLALFGPEFTGGHAALVWLTVGQLVNALTGSVGLLMTMTGHHRSVAFIVAISAALNVLFNAVLIPIAGIAGAAIATTATIVISNVAMCVVVVLRLRIDPTILSLLVRRLRRSPGAVR